jgi:hypothetical protein
MATRAERFRATAERKGGGGARAKSGAKRPGRTNWAERETAQLGTYDGTLPARETGRRNMSKSKSSRYELESSLTPKRPSRKQSRRSNNRQKTDSVLKGRQQLRVNNPKRRSAEHQRPGRSPG